MTEQLPAVLIKFICSPTPVEEFKPRARPSAEVCPDILGRRGAIMNFVNK